MKDEKMKYNYDSMPKSQARSDGMFMIKGETDNRSAYIVKEDLIYQRKGGHNLKIRMVYPDGLDLSEKIPLVIHIQGSGWFKQDLNNHILDFKDIITAGYILAIVEYLPIPDYTFPSQVEDAKMAARYLFKHADVLGIDTNNFFLMGDSSGGHTSLMCWATWKTNQLDAEGAEDPLPEIRGFIDLYGIVDLLTIAESESAFDHQQLTSPDSLILGGVIPHQDPEKARQAAILTYLDKRVGKRPLLIMHGNKDTVVPFEQSVQLFEECKKRGLDATFYCIDDADHGGPVFYCKEVLDTIICYLNEHLKT